MNLSISTPSFFKQYVCDKVYVSDKENGDVEFLDDHMSLFSMVEEGSIKFTGKEINAEVNSSEVEQDEKEEAKTYHYNLSDAIIKLENDSCVISSKIADIY